MPCTIMAVAASSGMGLSGPGTASERGTGAATDHACGRAGALREPLPAAPRHGTARHGTARHGTAEGNGEASLGLARQRPWEASARRERPLRLTSGVLGHHGRAEEHVPQSSGLAILRLRRQSHGPGRRRRLAVDSAPVALRAPALEPAAGAHAVAVGVVERK